MHLLHHLITAFFLTVEKDEGLLCVTRKDVAAGKIYKFLKTDISSMS